MKNEKNIDNILGLIKRKYSLNSDINWLSAKWTEKVSIQFSIYPVVKQVDFDWQRVAHFGTVQQLRHNEFRIDLINFSVIKNHDKKDTK